MQFTDNGTNFVIISFATLVFDEIPYYGDQWNNFKVILNFNNDTYRASVNGQLSSSKAFGDPGGEVELSTISFRTFMAPSMVAGSKLTHGRARVVSKPSLT